MPQPYLWLRQILAQLLPELEHLPMGPEGEARARAWFERLLARFAERGLTTPAQQKNRVVDVRNAIRARFGDDHPALAHVGFDEQTWQQINLPTHDRTEARNENQRLLHHPGKIVARAAKLLESPRFEDLAVGLGITVGRRISELLDGHAKLEPSTAWSVYFTGQRKHRGERENFSFEIPTLAPATAVLAAWQRLLVMLGDQVLDPQTINHRYGHAVNAMADHHFRGLVPPRLPPVPKPGAESLAGAPHGRERRGDALYLHLFRAVYATIAVHWFCPPRVNRLVFKAEIQGHRQILDASTPTMRRSYTASRHYDDYQIADASGKNIDGRQGIKLGQLPGVEVLRAFQTPRPNPTPELPPAGLTEGGDVSPPLSTPPSSPPPATAAMDPDKAPAIHAPPLPQPATNDSPPAADTPPAPDAGGDAPKVPKGKKPRPVTYRLYPADRPRLDAFRDGPKQSQADNLHGVLNRLEEAAAAARIHGQTQDKLQEALARVVKAEGEREQAHQEARAKQGRLQTQEEEVQRLHQSLDQARAQAAAAAPPAASSAIGQALLARELLAIATQEDCPPALQARLIALATQALGGQGNLENRQDAPAPPRTETRTGGARKAPKPTTDPARFGPLFAAPTALHPATHAGVTDAPPGSGEGKTVGGGPAKPVEAETPVDGVSVAPSERPANDAQQPPGAAKSTLAPPAPPRPAPRRGGAADKLGQALQAVLAHNQAQSARDKKWTITESALARLTGCFRPAVRAFFAQHAQQIAAHNHKHHLSGGLNAARGKRGETIETEIQWRDAPTMPPAAAADQEAAVEENAGGEDANHPDT